VETRPSSEIFTSSIVPLVSTNADFQHSIRITYETFRPSVPPSPRLTYHLTGCIVGYLGSSSRICVSFSDGALVSFLILRRFTHNMGRWTVTFNCTKCQPNRSLRMAGATHASGCVTCAFLYRKPIGRINLSYFTGLLVKSGPTKVYTN
jgi:hypothetical protein